MSKTVLIIEDEKPIVDILKFNLMREGYDTLEALDGLEGLETARTKDPDLILLDVMLPGMNGFDICATLRDEGFTFPILMLTAREEERDKVFGLEAGADDYITKPFSMHELMARVKANIRRRSMDAAVKSVSAEKLTAANVTIDLSSMTVYRDGASVEVSQKEYDLLTTILSQKGKIWTREELLEKVWNYDYYGDTRTVDVTIRRLREKIETNPAEPAVIKTKRGVGYFAGE